ncbi:putative nuclease HARBI1 [Prorops nasuta]|uniref:putative nuclease HARBI1 n=1 Tax=Prorops nasuta TaxID=863751 RepID=UPI0034CD6BCC
MVLHCYIKFAGNKVCIRDVAARFDMAESTFHFYSNNIMDFLNSIARSVITFPQTLTEKTNVAREFQSINGFPGIIRCVDGTYIPIRTPAHKKKSTYINKHDMTSLTLQGICDANKIFLDVFTGPPSKVHDARIFKLSFISKILPNVCEDQFHLLGDAAYPLRKYLITPYSDYGNLTIEQKQFNYKFSACRVKIENAFGLLKGRFRQLIRLDFCTVQRASKFIVACCYLHNLCIYNNDLLDYIDEVNIENFVEDNRIINNEEA